jgi:DNA-directed RNA polymerase subunit D
MDLVFTRLTDIEARFILNDATPAFANTIRRAMMTEVPTLAIEDVKIYDNTSVLFDEILSHRLALIPLKTEDLNLVLPSECTCGGEGCPGCSITYTLSVEGPGMAYSRDLIPDDPKAVPAFDNIPIVKLFEGQKVVIEARAVLGTGKKHSKWEGVLICGYKEFPVITISRECDGEICGRCVEECPRKILRADKDIVSVIEGRLEDCSMCKLCMKVCDIGEKPAINIDADDTRFIFVMESDGSISAKEIIKQALIHIRGKSADLSATVAELSGGAA